jgi:1-deoxy-D-xylulose-5-phosphate reductoisomerase
MLRIALLGSTGSIGRQTIDVVQHLGPLKTQIVALSAQRNGELLEQQARALGVRRTALASRDGIEKVVEMATLPEVDMVIVAISGAAALLPVWHAIHAGKRIGLANKEILVTGGALIMDAVRRHNVEMVPIDSETSALFQCLHARAPSEIRRLIITASGGPFRETPQADLDQVTPEQALRHPTWSMGPKITIDSSTLMNKALEVIEARWLFDIPPERISVMVHPQSIVHGLVELSDGAYLAHIARNDMRLPIQYAITYPERLPTALPAFDWLANRHWEFTPPDLEKFLCLRLGLEALQIGGSMTGWVNAANEILVERFLRRELSWKGIGHCLAKMMERHKPLAHPTLEELLAIDAEARLEAACI